MIEKLQDLVRRAGIRRYVRSLSADKELLAWVMDQTSDRPDGTELPERVYLLLHPDCVPECQHGSVRKFHTLVVGYRQYCGDRASCRCNASDHAEKIRRASALRTDDQWKAMSEKAKATSRGRYGVDVATQSEDIKAKVRRTNQDRHGGSSPMANPQVRAKVASTNLVRYGHRSPLGSAAVKAKIRATNLGRHGCEHTMGKARDAFSAGTGYANAFQHPDVKAAIRARLLERYGSDHPLRIDSIRKKVMDTNMGKLGVPWPGMSPEVMGKVSRGIRLNRLGEEVLALLEDEAWLRARSGPEQVADELGVSYSTALRALHRFGLVAAIGSEGERQVAGLVESLGAAVVRNDRKLLGGLEIDILVPERNLAIEYCGLFWHSELSGKDSGYHARKLDACGAKGYRLITVFEDEWMQRRRIAESRIRNLLGRTERGIPARKLVLRGGLEWAQAREFLDSYHIQGAGQPPSWSYGAFDDEEMVACMTFSRPRVSLGRRDGPVELLRYCTDGRSHPGIASRLLARFVSDHDPDAIMSYADRRWSAGELYRRLGFVDNGHSRPGYWYTDDYRTRHHRFGFRKHVISEGFDPSMSEWQIMQELGYDRIWDCGHLRFIWRK
jgi:G:T-mismatch repair DNA endonuclease (very short patch repair protein)